MPVGDEDHGGVALAVAVGFGAASVRALHLVIGQILACAHIGVFGRIGIATVRFTMAEGMVLTADLAMFCSRFEGRLFEAVLPTETKPFNAIKSLLLLRNIQKLSVRRCLYLPGSRRA